MDGISSSHVPSEEPFVVEGYYDGVPYRFVDGTAIDAFVRGEVVRFASFEEFVQPLMPAKSRYRGGAIVAAQAVACLLSALLVQRYYLYLGFVSGGYPDLLWVIPFATVGLVFLFARISFGYFVGYYFFAVLLTYAALTGSASAWPMLAAEVALFVPAIFLTRWPLRFPELGLSAFRLLLAAALIASVVILALAARYHFRIVSPSEIYIYRGAVVLPVPLGYALGMVTGALLPFAFACFALSKRWVGAAIALLLLFAAYPVTLAKLNLLGPAWMLFLFFLSRKNGPRATVMLSLLLPMVAGLLSVGLLSLPGSPVDSIPLFALVNFRLIAVPAISIDLYDRFFANHELTHFCQISFLKQFITGCPYAEPLAIVLDREYGFGNLNASLFATEGIASVGPLLTPLSAFACGLVLAAGNVCCSRLPARFMIVSGGMAVLALLNVPMTTALLTNGVGLLFLLWLLTPRSYFEARA